MKVFKHTFIALVTIIGPSFFTNCQGPLEDDVTLMVNANPNSTLNSSALYTNGDWTGEENNGYPQGNSVKAVEATYKKLIGTWICKKQVFVGEANETYNDDSRYMTLNADFTYKIRPYNLFEAEKRGGTWQLIGASRIMFDNDDEETYSIIQLTSSSLQLGWLEDNHVIEITTFTKKD